jgi:thioesterase domain-containing protein/acyl carrier protein
MVPSSVIATDALPLTPAGKVDLRALESSEQTEHRSGEASIPPRDDIELRVCKIWEEVLQVDGIGIRDHFFEVGGHSLLAVHLVNRISSEFGKNLSLADFIREPTVAQLAQLLRTGNEEQASSAVVPLRRGSDDRPPLFAICGIHLYREFAETLSETQSVYGIFLQEEVDAMATDEEHFSFEELETIEQRAANYFEQIRSVQPHGPYVIGGVSYGGLLAFEIAQQLIAAGEQVDLVVIIDTLMRNRIRRPLHRRLVSLAGSVIKAFHKAWRKAAGLYKERSEARRLGEIRTQIHIETAARYAAAPYDGEVMLVRAMEQLPGSGYKADPLLGWGHLLRGGCRNRLRSSISACSTT